VIDQVKLAELSRSSRLSGLFTSVGALAIFIALGLASWELAQLNAHINERKAALARAEKDLANEQTRLKQVEDQTKTLQAQSKLLVGRLSTVQTALEQQEPPAHVNRFLTSLRQQAPSRTVASVAQLTPLFAVVHPYAAAVPLPKPARGLQGYAFSVWLDVPPDRKDELASVSYLFDHPSFHQKVFTATNWANGFRVGYQGWGCLNAVQITLHLKEGTSQPMDFDMCHNLGWDSANRPESKGQKQ
jgi:hypothetical protein